MFRNKLVKTSTNRWHHIKGDASCLIILCNLSSLQDSFHTTGCLQSSVDMDSDGNLKVYDMAAYDTLFLFVCRDGGLEAPKWWSGDPGDHFIDYWANKLSIECESLRTWCCLNGKKLKITIGTRSCAQGH